MGEASGMTEQKKFLYASAYADDFLYAARTVGSNLRLFADKAFHWAGVRVYPSKPGVGVLF